LDEGIFEYFFSLGVSAGEKFLCVVFPPLGCYGGVVYVAVFEV
jgi:hypothetical protein